MSLKSSRDVLVAVLTQAVDACIAQAAVNPGSVDPDKFEADLVFKFKGSDCEVRCRPTMNFDDTIPSVTALAPAPALKINSDRLDTDWDDIHKLWADMYRFAQKNPKHTFVCADDPGVNYETMRVPRMGWSAFLEGAVPEDHRVWTIKLSTVAKTLRSNSNLEKINPDPVIESFQTPHGRQEMLKFVIGRDPKPCT